jgi:hypothetical protein
MSATHFSSHAGARSPAAAEPRHESPRPCARTRARSASVSGSTPARAISAWRWRKVWREAITCMNARLPVK